MRLQKANCSAVQSYLNEHVRQVQCAQCRFEVLYWGFTPTHLDNPVHKHSFYEICYVLDGKGSYTESGRTTPLAPGTMFLSRPERFHQIRSEQGLFMMWVAFALEETDAAGECARREHPLSTTERFILHDASDTTPALLWEALFQQAGMRSGHDELIANVAQSLLLSLVHTFTTEDQGSAARKGGPPSSAQLISQAKLFIRDNCSLPVRLRDVASFLHISERHLTRLFAEEVGQPFTRYLNAVRIRKACEMLRETEWTHEHIAGACGFDSVHYFTRVFTRVMGMPPGRYRKQHAD